PQGLDPLAALLLSSVAAHADKPLALAAATPPTALPCAVRHADRLQIVAPLSADPAARANAPPARSAAHTCHHAAHRTDDGTECPLATALVDRCPGCSQHRRAPLARSVKCAVPPTPPMAASQECSPRSRGV